MRTSKLIKGRLRQARLALVIVFGVNACVLGGAALLARMTFTNIVLLAYLAAMQGLIVLATIIIDAFLKEIPFVSHAIPEGNPNAATAKMIREADRGDFLVLDSADLLPAVSFLRHQENRSDLTIVIDREEGGVKLYE